MQRSSAQSIVSYIPTPIQAYYIHFLSIFWCCLLVDILWLSFQNSLPDYILYLLPWMTSQALIRDFKARPADLFFYTQQQLMPETYQVESHQVLGKCALMGRLSLPFQSPEKIIRTEKKSIHTKRKWRKVAEKGHDTLELTFNDSARRHNFHRSSWAFTRQQISMETVRVLCCGISFTQRLC